MRKLVDAPRKKKQWTEKEEAYLQDKWGTVSIKGLSKALGRSENAIIVRAQRLGCGAHLESDVRISLNQFMLALYGGAQMGGYTSNRLIQNGAAVCLGPEDVLEAFGIKFEKKTRADKKTEKRLAKNENMVYSFLDSRSGTLEEIMDACGLSVTETMECLLKLELMGMVQGNGDQYYCRKL